MSVSDTYEVAADQLASRALDWIFSISAGSSSWAHFMDIGTRRSTSCGRLPHAGRKRRSVALRRRLSIRSDLALSYVAVAPSEVLR